LIYWLDGWLDTRSYAPESQQEPQEPIVTDEDIAAMIDAWSRLYRDSEHATEHQREASRIQGEYSMDNSAFFDILYKAKDDTDYSGDKSMRSFFDMLDRQLRDKSKKVG
jgi:hypothetical protein